MKLKWGLHFVNICSLHFHFHSFAVSSYILKLNLGRMLEDLHSCTFPLRSLAAHNYFWPQPAWKVFVALENAVGAHPHGWVGSTWKCSVCLHHSVETSCFDQQRVVRALVWLKWFTQSSHLRNVTQMYLWNVILDEFITFLRWAERGARNTLKLFQ